MSGKVEMTNKGYASVPNGKDSASEQYTIPIPKDEHGNEMSYEDAATSFEHWTMKFMNPVFQKGTTGLNHKDLGKVSEQDKANNLYKSFWEQWLLETKKQPKHRSLWRVLWRSVGYSKMLKALGLYFIFSALGFIPVFVLKWLMGYLEGQIELTEFQMDALPSCSSRLSFHQ